MGVSDAEVLERSGATKIHTVRTLLSRMVVTGAAFAAGYRTARRYFADSAAAAAHAEVCRQQAREARRASARIRERARYVPTPRAPRLRRERHAAQPSNRWTEEQVTKLRELYPHTADTQAVADALGKSLQAVKQYACKLGIAKLVQKSKTRAPRPRVSLRVERPPKPVAAPSAPTLRVGEQKRGPAYMPGDIDTLPRSPGFRHVVCPSPPHHYRTNTHSAY
jgi:hypothetical protein